MTDPPTGEHTPSPNVILRVIGGILIAAGALLTLGAGLCTLWFVATPLLQGGSTRFLGLSLILGGLPMIYGGILCWSGKVLWHSRGGLRPLGLLLAVLLLGAFFFYVFMQSGPFGPS